MSLWLDFSLQFISLFLKSDSVANPNNLGGIHYGSVAKSSVLDGIHHYRHGTLASSSGLNDIHLCPRDNAANSNVLVDIRFYRCDIVANPSD